MLRRHEVEQLKAHRRGMVVGAIGLVVALGTPPTALAVPPPPPNPSDEDLRDSERDRENRAGEVGRLTNRLSEAESKLSRLRDDVSRKLELANKARVDAQSAEQAANDANAAAAEARKETEAANDTVENARKGMDEFAASSYRQGSKLGSMSAYVSADDAKHVLDRAQMLDAVGKTRLNALEELRMARTEKSNSDAAARKALQRAEKKEKAADAAKQTAEQAHQVAVDARQSQSAKAKELEGEVERVEKQLWTAQRKVKGLQGQREKYEEWVEAKRREEELERRRAALAAEKRQREEAAAARESSSAGSSGPSAPAGSSVESVISRAMSQRGKPYAWGGGNQSGPTRGIRDGGVADTFGDFNKVGFDCSGLMIYAFAGVVDLPHYSGYQSKFGRKVPLSQMKRGDMLFWGHGGIHHVALYLGNGQMVEAPQSGSVVKVSPVRYGDITPFAVRVID